MCFKQTYGSVCLLIVALIQTIPQLYCTGSQCSPITITASSRPPELLRSDVSDSKIAQENPIRGGWRVAFWADAHTRKHTLQTVPLPYWVVLAHSYFSVFFTLIPLKGLHAWVVISFLCVPYLTLLNLDSTQSPLSSCPQMYHSAFLYCLSVIS